MNRLLAPGIAGVAGYLLFFLLYTSADPAARWGLSLDRDEARRQAVELAGRFGLATADWPWAVTAEERDLVPEYLETHPDSAASPYLDRARIGVWLRAPDGAERVRVWMGGRGQYREIDVRRSGDGDLPDPEQASRAAHEALEKLVRSPAQFQLLPDQPSQTEDAFEFVWETVEESPEVVPRFEVRLDGSGLRRARLEPRFSEAFDDAVDDREDTGQLLRVLLWIAMVPAVIAALAFYVSGSFRRLVDQRSVLLLILAAGALHLMARVAAGYWDAERIQDDTLLEAMLIGLALLVGLVAPCAAGVWGASFALTGSVMAEKTVTAEILWRRGPQVRAVALSLLWGWAAAGWVGSAPYLLGAIAGPLEARLAALDPGSVMAPLPLLAPLDAFTHPPLLLWGIVFAFWYPLSIRLLKRPFLYRAAQLGVAVLFLTVPFRSVSLIGVLTAGLVAALLSDRLYWRRDLAAVLVIPPALLMAQHAGTHLAQPADGLQSWGLVMAGLLALPLPLLGWFAFRGTEVDMEQEVSKRRLQALRLENMRKAERERLLAEFSVARQAQRQMLPDTPPRLEGYRLAAVCQPAREVGGDFYDFVQLGDSEWGVVVADVSGKGVPAALYMTLTKGLLQSLGDDGRPSADLVVEVNRHLFAVARHRVFVTMALSVLDPETGRVDCFRAGHNPPLWRRAASAEVQVIRPSGLGLGLTAGDLFERSLAAEKVGLEAGDALFLYSDGIPEAMDRQGREYGDQRLLDLIGRTGGLSAEQSAQRVLEDVRRFLDGHPPNDDITLVVLERLAD